MSACSSLLSVAVDEIVSVIGEHGGNYSCCFGGISYGLAVAVELDADVGIVVEGEPSSGSAWDLDSTAADVACFDSLYYLLDVELLPVSALESSDYLLYEEFIFSVHARSYSYGSMAQSSSKNYVIAHDFILKVIEQSDHEFALVFFPLPLARGDDYFSIGLA